MPKTTRDFAIIAADEIETYASEQEAFDGRIDGGVATARVTAVRAVGAAVVAMGGAAKDAWQAWMGECLRGLEAGSRVSGPFSWAYADIATETLLLWVGAWRAFAGLLPCGCAPEVPVEAWIGTPPPGWKPGDTAPHVCPKSLRYALFGEQQPGGLPIEDVDGTTTHIPPGTPVRSGT